MTQLKKMLIYTSFPYFPRLETELEIVDNYLAKGYDVVMISCMGDLALCPDNQKIRKIKCMCCHSRLKAGYNWLKSEKVVLKGIRFINAADQKVIDDVLSCSINSWDDLKSIDIGGSDVGLAAFSELVSLTRNPKPPLSEKNRDMAKKLLNNALIVHFSIKNHILKENPDVFILFNGRISAYRPALRIGQYFGIDTKVFEVSSNYRKYILIDNTYPHDLINMQGYFKKTFDASKDNEAQKQIIANEWYNNRIGDLSGKINPFAYKHKRGSSELNDVRDFSGLKVGIFISSEDEFVAISEHINPFYVDQNHGIEEILNGLKDENILFIIRAHPNLKKLFNDQIIELNAIVRKRYNVKYIPPSSKISSYELIEICDIILTFGSTIGIEAAYMGKPSILMGVSSYRGLGGTIEPESHDELLTILKESAELGHLPNKYEIPRDIVKRACTVYAYGLLESGVPHKYQKLTSHSKISWIEKDGVRTYIRPNVLCRVINGIDWYVKLPLRVLKRTFIFIKIKLFFG